VEKASGQAGSQMARGVAEAIRTCSGLENVWTGKDLHSIESGELYEGTGTHFKCNIRLCPFCSSSLGRRSCKKLRRLVQLVLSGRGELPNYWNSLRWRFLTLSGPKSDGLPLLLKLKVHQLAWELFHKRKFFQDLDVEACSKG
jgi:hypothetical protein